MSRWDVIRASRAGNVTVERADIIDLLKECDDLRAERDRLELSLQRTRSAHKAAKARARRLEEAGL